MKKITMLAAFLFAALWCFSGREKTVLAETVSEKQVDVLFTHDTHSHLNSFLTLVDGETKEIGGFARLKTQILQQKEKNPDTLILDAGDYSMGTLMQTIYSVEASELRMLGALGCDVTTLGNHEFDYRSQGLADSLESAVKSGDPVPAMVLCNIDWESMEKSGLTREQQLLKDAFEAYGMQDYVVLEKGNVKIAVIGVFGEDSYSCAPTCVLKFRNAGEAVKETVERIRKEEAVDMIVCVSHSGTSEDEKKSEDELLAKAVPEIDLIISGHSHTVLEAPIIHGDTAIVSCGEYGKNLGSLSMEQKENGRWEVRSYELFPITADVPEDEETQHKIDHFMEAVNREYLDEFGYNAEDVVAENKVEFCTVKDLSGEHVERNLGNIIADAYHYAAETRNPDADPVDVAICPSGTVRETYPKGNITVQDIFNSFSLGIGEDGVPGYPLISVYLTGKELKTIAEIDASISDIMLSARLFNYGLYFTYNPHRLILNRVTDCYLADENGARTEIQNDKLYQVVTDLYTGQMLGTVTDISFGLLSIVPKNQDSVPYENISDAIIKTSDGELKAWDAIVQYMRSFQDEDGNGIPDIPESYASFEGRKTVDDSKKITDLIRNPNRFTFMILAVVGVTVLLLFAVVRLIVRRIRKRRKLH